MQRYVLAANWPSLRSDVQQFETESANDLPSSAIGLRHWRDYRDGSGMAEQVLQRDACGAQCPSAAAGWQHRPMPFVKAVADRLEDRTAIFADERDVARVCGDSSKIKTPDYRAAHPRVNTGVGNNRIDRPRIVDAVDVAIVWGQGDIELVSKPFLQGHA
jgi:hypothetical protein